MKQCLQIVRESITSERAMRAGPVRSALRRAGRADLTNAWYCIQGKTGTTPSLQRPQQEPMASKCPVSKGQKKSKSNKSNLQIPNGGGRRVSLAKGRREGRPPM